MKRVLTVQDISCVGRCSLTVALPILSAMGLETAILPTAVLSTHTQFQGFTFRDLTGDLNAILEHWKKEEFTFDTVYTGYLGSKEQIDIVVALFEYYKKTGSTLIADPAMADNGKLYSHLSPDQPKAMASLAARADVLLPNRTEAALMTGLPMDADPRDLCRALKGLGCKEVLLTGHEPAAGRLGTLGYDGEHFTETCNRRLPASFHGTGDLFSSVYFGARLLGLNGTEAADLAGNFVADAIESTMAENAPKTRGVQFEPLLWQLGQTIAKKENQYGNRI